MEDYLLECLDVALKAGISPDKLSKHADAKDAWDALAKPWKGLLIVALAEDAGGGTGNSPPGRRRMRGRPVRNSGGSDWIEGMDGLVASNAPPGYRLSAMLVQKARLKDKWNPTWDSELKKAREICEGGVHPVWHRLASKSQLLAEMQLYPEVEGSTKSHIDPTEWANSARFDPKDRGAMVAWLTAPFPFSLSAKLELSIQRLAKTLSAKGKAPRVPESFNLLDDDSVLIRALVRICSNDGGSQDLRILIEKDGIVSSVARDHFALVELRSGEMSAWEDCHAAKGEDGLSTAMRYQSWINAPEDAELTASEIQDGISLLNDGEDRRILTWSLVKAQIREGAIDAALQSISSLNIVDSSKLNVVLKLIEESEDVGLIGQLSKGIHRIENQGLELIMQSMNTPLDLRSLAAIEYQNREDLNWDQFDDMALDIFTEVGDANRIGSILMKMENGASLHPHCTLLVHHLLPGNADKELCDWVFKSRPEALEVLANESSGVLSETSIGLVKLLEGAPADLAAIQRRVAGNREAIRAFNQCRQAMLKDGDGLVPANRLEKLQSSIQNSSLSGVELRLFTSVLDRLQFNRAIRLLEDNNDDSTKLAISTLENLVGENPPKGIVDSIRQVILEHDSIAIPAFAEWHRLHAASSSWHQIILASIEEMAGNHLSAGRSLRRASMDLSFSFENRVRLARRGLIAFAHAGRFSEAVEMLESQQALHSALTGLFQLYLHVCDDATRQQPEAARRRLLDWIADTEIFTEENVDGGLIERERKTYPSDELDILFTYPNLRNLPKEPWQGRVRSAIRGIRENRRSPRSQLESRFRNMLADNASVQEVESVAGEASALNPTQGLMMFERAMDSGKFSNNEMKALLRSQNGIFRLNESTLPIRVRRKLRHLTLRPLILVDTNILIDAAKESIGLLLDEEGGIDTNAHGSFHRTVLYKAKAGMVELFIPEAAKNEFKNMIGNLERVRSLFGDVWLNEAEWGERVTQEAVQKICKQVLSDYETWSVPPSENHEMEISKFEDKTIEFMLEQRQTYLEVVDSKVSNNPNALTKRTKIEGEAIYPERGDRDIMRDAALIADSTHKGIGAVLIASRDSDFWIVRRSLEESFGFGVVRTARELSQWV